MKMNCPEYDKFFESPSRLFFCAMGFLTIFRKLLLYPLVARLERQSAFFPVMGLPGRLNLTGFVAIFD